MFKTELHLHTFPVSSCARLSPEEMIRLHKLAGYDSVFISDHFSKYHFDRFPPNLTWEQQIDFFLDAYVQAKYAGDKLGVHVLLSAELTVENNHYLLYGIDRRFLLSRPDIFSFTIEDFSAHAKAHGIVFIQAHPLRDGKCTPQPDWVDGMEVFNANVRHENDNDNVFEIAKAHNIPMVVGSDAHIVEDIGRAAVLSDDKIISVEQFLDLLMCGKLRLMCGNVIL